MSPLLADARRASGLTQAEVARLAGTSRPNVSAFEHGRRSPTLDTLERLLAANGQRLVALPELSFEQRVDRRGKPFFVPNQLPQLSPSASLARVTLPKHVNWSSAQESWDLSDRTQRLLAYQLVLAEGAPSDISTFIDGSLLIDLWSELFLPPEIRAAWQRMVDQVLGRDLS
jgi:transcriptional regulator with XRE-family HTH domain